LRFARRQLLLSFRRRLPRYVPAILAITVAAAAVGALTAIGNDIARKMAREFRQRGANAVARSRSGKTLPPSAVKEVSGDTAVERALPVSVREGAAGPRRFLIVGMDFSAAGPFLSGWDIDGRLPSAPTEALAGARLFERLGLGRSRDVEVAIGAERRRYSVVGKLATGEGEDEELIVARQSLPGAEAGAADAVLLRLSGSGEAVARAASRLERETGARVDPLLAISTSEGRIVVRLRGILTALGIAIAVLAALGTATTLMASVVARKREIALEKSLGAGEGRLVRRFLAEGAALGAIGGLAGTAVGLLAADRLERGLFGVPLTFTWPAAALPFGLSVAIAAAASLPALHRMLAIEAITALREE